MPPNSPSKRRRAFDPSEQKTDGLWVQLKGFGKLWPYLWPDDKPLYKVRIILALIITCLLYTSPSPRDGLLSRMPSSA